VHLNSIITIIMLIGFCVHLNSIITIIITYPLMGSRVRPNGFTSPCLMTVLCLERL